MNYPNFFRQSNKRPSRVKTPTVLQMEAVECGAAALAILLGYYKRFVPLEELRIACGVSRDGSKAINILRAARAYGLEGNWYRRSLEQVLTGPLPVIVFWNFNHFLVVEGSQGDTVYINDPAAGPRRITRAEFDRSYTGISLEVQPDAAFTPQGAQGNLWQGLRERMVGLSGAFALLVGISLLLVIPTLVTPTLLQIFIDRVLVRNLQRWPAQLMASLLLAIVLAAGLTWLQQTLLLRMELRMALGQSTKFVWHILRLPLSFFDQRYRGDISSRIDANDAIANLIGGGFGAVLLNCLTSLLLALVMLAYSPTLTAIAVTMPVAAIIMLRRLERRRTDLSTRFEIEQAKLMSTSIVGLQTIETLKALGGEGDFFAKWSGYHARTINTEQELARFDVFTSAFSPLWQGLVTAGILGLGSLFVIQGDLTIGRLVAFYTLSLTFQSQFRRLIDVVGQAQRSAGQLARLDDAWRYPLDWRHAADASATAPAPADADERQPLARAAGRLTLRNLGFRFSPLDPEFIQDLNLDVAPGGWVALVGRSGSGKSTLGRLITGLYTPSSGDVLLDGQPLHRWQRDQLANSMATVDQEIAIFGGALSDNLTLWDATVPEAQIVDAVRDAALTDVVEALPDGYRSPLSENGDNLSGGQRQRVEIARALVRNPALIVLDEATSALDAVTELHIAQALRRRGCTCIMVAHRLSTIRDADEIIVLDQGKIVERGHHAELLAADGQYAQLIAEE
ncbi:MAG: NHLP family bacteriocin export ABC transporter peptidase/permease/ATPase subunit [Caldilineaceae bacterium]|nr:NHLP family bacteriocin export ABC transporter peptidase/permease/ATPase subunit [Caldilineaceae bacterium]MCB0140741.1 NHLP family bacteriocin export ABC transporter peptidase/permease/ATPase subunit [Caldilineaceae bacterium]